MKRIRPFLPVFLCLVPFAAFAAVSAPSGENPPLFPGAPSVEELDAAATEKHALLFDGHPDPGGAIEAEAFVAGAAIASRAPAVALATRAAAPTHTVYGWAPYWQTSSDIASYEYSNLTHVAYFSYEVNPTNGGCLNMHGWTTTPLVETAHSNGVKVVLTATLFGSAGNKLLLQNTNACNKLATNLVNAVVSRGGDGICIDFESVGSWTGATAALNKFMTNLIAKAHAANLEVGIALPSVDWYADFGVGVYETAGIDQMLVMGYDYYYAGSSTPGPVAPLKSSAKWVGASSWCSVDYSVQYYLAKLSSPAKLMLAVPFYGRRWGAKSAALGAESLGSSYSSALAYASCASLASTYGRKWETNASVPYCVYTNSSVVRQCFYDDAESLGLKFDYAKTNSLGGIGIWCLTQAHSDLWDAVADAFGGAEGGDAGDDDNTGSETGGIDATELVTWDFTAAEGWKENGNNFIGTTNAAGGAWYFKDIDVYPSAVNDADTGYLDLQVATDYLFTPVSTNWSVTRIETVARPYSTNTAGRELTLLGSTDGGTTWRALGSFRMTTPNANTTNSLTLPVPLSGSVRIAVSNSASYSIKLCRLSLYGLDTSGDDTAVEETGGDGDASGSNPSWWFEFNATEGWTLSSDENAKVTTNLPSGRWELDGTTVKPAEVVDGNTGYLNFYHPTNRSTLTSPVFTNQTFASVTLVTRPATAGSNREMTLYASTNGGASHFLLGAVTPTTAVNHTNTFTAATGPLSGDIVLKIVNSGSLGSVRLLALGLTATATNTPSAGDTTSVSRWFDFIPSEGWTLSTNENATVSTNVNSGTWTLGKTTVKPTDTYDGNTGYLYVYYPTNASSVTTPVFTNESLSSVTLVARPYGTGGTGRELTLFVSTNGGNTFAQAGTMAPTGAVNLTNTFTLSPPHSGDIALKVVNSGSAGSIRLLALGTEGTAVSGGDDPGGGGGDGVVASYDFTIPEGWTTRTNNSFTGVTNVAGEAWTVVTNQFQPATVTGTDVGYVDLTTHGSTIRTPVYTNVSVTGVVLVARPYSTNSVTRELTALVSADGGSTWRSLGSFRMTSPSVSVTNAYFLTNSLEGDVSVCVSNSGNFSIKLLSLSILGTTNSSSGGGDSGGGEGGEGGGGEGGGDSGGGSAIDIPTVSGLPSADAEQPRGVLSGVTVFTSGGHGYTANNADTPTYWYTGRGNTHDVNEDTGNLDQLNFFAEEAWRMGATVVPMRPLGHQTNEVVLDNEDAGVSYAGNWTKTGNTNYYFGRKGAVAYRYANANPTGVTATAVYRPTLPAAGEYPVYTWVRHGSDRVNQHYRIHHAGGTASVRVHHGRVGSGWVWLGNYFFAAGTNGCVEILNDAPEETSTANVVVADAIRFGNGMGDIARGNAGVSGYERELEASRYWIQRQVLDSVGYSSSLYDLSGYYDQSDNVGAPSRMAVNMVRTNGWARWRRVYIGFHSNASKGATRGTWGLYDTRTLQNHPSTYGLYQTNFASIVAKRCQTDLSVAAAEGIVPSWTTSSRIYGSNYGEIYGGSIYLAMDAIINEVAFHDNAYDAAVMKTLAGREWLARASARGTAEFLSKQYSAFPNALVFPPDAPVGVKAVADGTTVTVGWRMPEANAASGGAPDGFTVYASTDGTAFGRPVSVPGGNATSVAFEGLDAGQTLFFRVAATNAGGESAASAVAGARTPDNGGKAATLVVSAFTRADAALSPKRYLTHYCASSGGGDTTLVRRRAINDRSYVKEHGLALAANGEAFDSCEADAVTMAFLTGYRNVVWCLGEESTDDETFSAEEQAMVSAFLAGGGNLFASGAEIAWDLGAKGSATDAAFLAGLGAAYAADSGGTGTVTGAAGGIFAGTALSFNYTNLLDTTYAAGYPDVLAATNGAKVAAVYGSSASGSSAAAVSYANATYRTVVMGFPFELIGSESARARAMGQVLDFFAAGGSGGTGTGGLRFDLTPAEATWTAGGVAHVSGETAELAEGTYTVAFSDVAGYVTPEARTVAVAAGATNAGSVAYEAASGALCIALVPGNGTWTLGGTEYASGETVPGLPQGDYAVSFSPLAGYATPAARTFAVAAGETNAFTVAYDEVATGTVTFTLVPPTGTWTIDGTTNASGDTVTLPAGTYTVSFGAPEGYYKPANRAVTVVGGQNTSETQVFEQKPGSIKITLKPDGLAGAAWCVLGTNYASGATAKVPAGTHEITFVPVAGWVTPEAISLTVAADKTVSRTVTYREEPSTGTVTFTLVPAEGTTWTIDGATYASGETATVEEGTYPVTFGALEGWTAPAATNVTVVAGGAFAGTAAYTETVPEDGFLTFTLEPAEGTTWMVAGTTNASGETVSLPAGSYTVKFGALTGYTKPDNCTVAITSGQTTSEHVAYTVKQVPLTVKFSPADVQTLATWSLDGIEGAHTNAESVKVDPGTYTVTASDVDGWTTPAPTNVTINVGASSKTITMKYVEAPVVPTTGTVTFTLMPAEGTSWTINGTTYASGQTATVEEGTYTVTFGELEGYTAPAATNVTVVAGESFAGNATYTEQAVPVASPVLGEATGVTTGAFSIAWSGVDGATGYTVQVAGSATFDDNLALEESFADGTLPEGWEAEKVSFATNKTVFSGDGKGVAIFSNKVSRLRTPKLARPGRVSWYHAKNRGSAESTAWSYVLECASDSEFSSIVATFDFEVSDAVTVPVTAEADLGGLHDVYLRWRDTRASGSAQRYFSAIAVRDGLEAEKNTGGTDASFDGLEAGTVYYVRAKATTAAGDSAWSAVKAVRTSDPPQPPAAPVLEEATDVTSNAFSIAWSAVEGAGIYQLQVAETAGFDEEPVLSCDFTGDLPAGWETTGVVTNHSSYAANDGGAVIFKGANKFLRTPLLAHPGTLTWHHATTSADEWRYELQASPTTDFDGAAVIRTFVVTQKLGTAVVQTENLRYYRNVYLRWVDTRPSGTAQRYISGISLTGALVTNATITATASRITALSAGTAYFVRARAWNDAGWSDWSEVKTVTTEAAPVAPTTGTVAFTLVPAEGTSWTIAGTTYASGQTATVEEGTYTVTFGELEGWTAPASTNVTVAAGDALSFAVAYEEDVPPPATLAAPVLAVGGKTAESIELSWNAVADATGYRVQVALDDAFTDGGTALSESFEESTDLPAGWDGTATVVANASYAAKDGGSNVVKFAASGKYVTTPPVAFPETLSFHWSTGSNATNWQLGVYVSNSVLGAWTNVGTIAVAAKTNATETIDLSAYGEAVVKFVDERASGSAARYLDAVTVTTADGSLVLDWETPDTALVVEGLESATPYFIRALATNAALSSAWSDVATATTEPGGGSGEGGLVELVPLATAGTDGLHVTATDWPDAFAVEFTTNLPDTNAWTLLPATEWTFSGGELVLPATNAFSAFRLVAP
jgi:spore germination protein YaaH